MTHRNHDECTAQCMESPTDRCGCRCGGDNHGRWLIEHRIWRQRELARRILPMWSVDGPERIDSSIRRRSMTDEPANHRWSGWPGAWCLDCGQADVTEACVANHDEAFGAPITDDNPYGMRPHCVNGPCPEPGSDRHNPYVKRERA